MKKIRIEIEIPFDTWLKYTREAQERKVDPYKFLEKTAEAVVKLIAGEITLEQAKKMIWGEK